jgi:hypothetical protein
MLSLGVFGGKYTTDCAAEFTAEWLSDAKLRHERHGPALNLFGILASQPLAALLGAMADPFLSASARKSVPRVRRSRVAPSSVDGVQFGIALPVWMLIANHAIGERGETGRRQTSDGAMR